MPDERLSYRHVDVFADQPFVGNGLTVFPNGGDLSAAEMQAITVEMRQFETIFLKVDPDRRWAEARVFTMEEELRFAGHPALGAACVLHERFCPDEARSAWTVSFPAGESTLTVTTHQGRYKAAMDQGRPDFGPSLDVTEIEAIVAGLSLSPDDLDTRCAPQVVSTGLPYLTLPLRTGLERCRIQIPNFEDLLAGVGADFVYVLDVVRREGRTWDNAGLVEDIATGSAAGPAAAYLVDNDLASPGSWFEIHQGRLVGRPSVIRVRVTVTGEGISRVEIAGAVTMVARGALDGLPG